MAFIPKKWLLFIYNLPTSPSRARVSVWRQLKKAGSVSYQQSVWLLPESESAGAIFTMLGKEIAEAGGTSAILKGESLSEEEEKRILDVFRKARDAEYEEVIERCEDFFTEIEKETRCENFNFAEVEENEVELTKLQKWFELVRKRDFIGTGQCSVAQAMLRKCEELLQDFSEKVFQVEQPD